MSRTLVVDTGPLIALAHLKLLPALPELFDEAYVAGAVLESILADGSGPAAQEVAHAWKEGWIVSYPEKDITIESDIGALLDLGLAESIYLTKHTRGILLTDDIRSRKICKRKGVKVVGLPAMLLTAYRGGFLHRLKPALVALSDFGYKLSPETAATVIEKAR